MHEKKKKTKKTNHFYCMDEVSTCKFVLLPILFFFKYLPINKYIFEKQ